MCYFLYASLYGNVPEEEYQFIQKKYSYRIPLGSKHDVKIAVNKSGDGMADNAFRVTDWMCDCDSPVGNGNPNDTMIVELKDLIHELSALRGVKQINICKSWTGHKINAETRVSLKDIDPADFLAKTEGNHLYTIDLI